MAEKTSLENKHLCKHVSFCYNYYSFLLAFHKKKTVLRKHIVQLKRIWRMKGLLMCVHIVVKPLNLEISCRP